MKKPAMPKGMLAGFVPCRLYQWSSLSSLNGRAGILRLLWNARQIWTWSWRSMWKSDADI